MTDGHHPWCNFWGAGPVETCKQCKDLYARFPPGESHAALIAKYFPGVVVVRDSDINALTTSDQEDESDKRELPPGPRD